MSAETNVNSSAHPDPTLPPPPGQGPADNPALDGKMAAPSANSKHTPFGISLDPKTYANKTDELIVRLNNILKTPGGLTAFLGTLNYALYIVAHAESISPSRAEIIAHISRLIGRTPSKLPPAALKPSSAAVAAVPSPVTNLALNLADTRTTLRLTGLIPMYVALKTLMRSQKDPNRDSILHSIAIAQCLSYMGFQALENIHHLTNKAVLSPDLANRITGGKPAMVMTYACRCWLAGITFDFFRLVRQSQLNSEKAARGEKMTAQEQKDYDAKWWNDLFVATSWYPMAVHYAVDGGVGLNLGMVGLCGFGAYVGRFLDAWRASN